MPILTLQDFLDPAAERMDCFYPNGFEAHTPGDSYCLSFANGEKRIATRADLDLIDPRLADAIGNFVSRTPNTLVPELIEATLRHWLLPVIEKPRNGSGPRNYFSRIHAIEMPAPDRIDLFADTYSMHRNTAGIPVANVVDRNNTWTLSPQDLEAQYPGSVDRLQVGLAIGMHVEDLVRQITSDGKVVDLGQATLPDLAI